MHQDVSPLRRVSLRSLCSRASVVIVGLLLSGTIYGRSAVGDKTVMMPVPASVQMGQGAFPVTAHLRMTYGQFHDARLEGGVDRMLRRLEYVSGQSQSGPKADGAGELVVDVKGAGAVVQTLEEDESYSLVVSTAQVKLSAATVVGALHGMETLLQLIECERGACHFPAVKIEDSPRFRWRGLMVDVSRHFEPVSMIERTLDGMAVVKLNVFHWHLSDDQGFRAESKRFPKLTGMGSGGQFYTQEQMREVVAYARARGIRVVPEFDMPGHSVSWLIGYPEYGSSAAPTELPVVFGIHDESLDPTEEKTYKFLDALIEEMGQIFPDAYFHIGGDENTGKAWRENPKIAAFMKAKGIKDTDALQAYFNQRLLPILTKHGKHMIGWDEVLTPGLPKDVIVQSWRGGDSLAKGARQGYTGILSAPYYLDGMKTAEEHYLADPIPSDVSLTAEEKARILGGEVCMWSEHLNERTIDSRIWPRTAAVAERFWSAASVRDVADMYRRLWPTSLELELVGLNHISGPQRALRSLAASQNPVALTTFASVLEPVSFSDRYEAQHTDATTPLSGLVDAVVPDPPSRFEIRTQVDAVVSGGSAAEERRRALAQRFQSWQDAIPALTELVARSPRMPDAQVRVTQLEQLAKAGTAALGYLQSGQKPPSGWSDQQLQLIKDAENNAALVRFTFLPSLRKLILAAAQ
ncbi:MAG TPA: beta-N-acetylhexosaminidase [Edaphobacter sp.]|nr:beta-N-acetylhexosaminidase [Edaphobacter sp.]